MLWLAGLMGVMAVGASSIVDISTEEDDQDTGFEDYDTGLYDDIAGSNPNTIELTAPEASEVTGASSQDAPNNPLLLQISEDLAALSSAPAAAEGEADFDLDLADEFELISMDGGADDPDVADDAGFVAEMESEDLADLNASSSEMEGVERTEIFDPFANDPDAPLISVRPVLGGENTGGDSQIVDELIEEVDEVLQSALPNFLAGTAGDDALSGTDGSDWIDGYAGSDSLDGGDGDDKLNGMSGAGANAIFGGMSEGGAVTEDPLFGATQADVLDGGEGDDTIFADGGDIVIGGEGSDQVVMGDWVSSTGDPVHVSDFDSGEDEIVLVWDNYAGDEPEVALSADEDDPSLMNILLDDAVVAQVPAGSGLTVDQINLMPLNEASTVRWGWA